jgi:hypothetical protein
MYGGDNTRETHEFPCSICFHITNVTRASEKQNGDGQHGRRPHQLRIIQPLTAA